MADFVLEHGLGGASLRTLAAAVGTSDRMLLYYFQDRHELLAATLERVAARLTARLDATFPAGTRLAFEALLPAVWTIVGSPELKPYIRLWLDIAAAALHERQPERIIAAKLLDGFAAWVAAHLDACAEAPRGPALLLATIEGALFFEAIGRGDLAALAVAQAAGQGLDPCLSAPHDLGSGP